MDQTCFYAGGGQPADYGTIAVDGLAFRVTGIETDGAGTLWHQCDGSPPPDWLGRRARLQVDPERRSALSRYHTVLHVLNTVALRDHGAWITGAQIRVDYARIDFKWEGFSSAVSSELERKVNGELSADRRLRAYSLTEEEFSRRPELLRTLEVRPPVSGRPRPCGGDRGLRRTGLRRHTRRQHRPVGAVLDYAHRDADQQAPLCSLDRQVTGPTAALSPARPSGRPANWQSSPDARWGSCIPSSNRCRPPYKAWHRDRPW